MFFQPDLIWLALALTICATQRTTISLMVTDLEGTGDERARYMLLNIAPRHIVPHKHLLVSLHDVLKGSEEVLLEPEVSQLSFLQKLHGQLTQGVCHKEGHLLAGQAADLHTTPPVLQQHLTHSEH